MDTSIEDTIGNPHTLEPGAPEAATFASPALSPLPATDWSATAPDPFMPVIGASMRERMNTLRVFARQNEAILIGGPTGSGKTRLARWCHARSPREGRPFEVLDLATVPEDQQMGELFGWCTGSRGESPNEIPGAVRRAEGGTLFIDEVDKLSPGVQSALLRLLEDGHYRPLGEGAAGRVANVRLIVCANADLAPLVDEGRLRFELHNRLNVLPVQLPPLCDRADEILPWAHHMLRRRHQAANASGQPHLSDEAARRLRDQPWPGNLRQLDNVLLRAYALSLVDAGGATERLHLTLDHIDRALSHEARPGKSRVLELMETAAEAFAGEAERRADGTKLDLDLTESFKGMVIDAARSRLGGDDRESLRRAFWLLGKEQTVEGRNHSAVYRREQEKMAAVRRALTGEPT